MEELKERICGFIERTVQDTPSAKEAMKYAIAGILDEARNEWPTHEMANKILRERTGKWEGGLAEAAKQQILASLRQDWFLKWLANIVVER